MTEPAAPDQTDELAELRETVRRLETMAAAEPAGTRTRSLADLAPLLYAAAGGDPASKFETRAIADVTVAGNPGLVPPAYSSEIIGRSVAPFRPFFDSVRRIPTPASGMTISFPRITGYPSTGIQTTEKTEVASGALQTDLLSFSGVTVAGAADLSMQFILRSDPSGLALFLDELAASYGINCDAVALDELVSAGPTAGTGALDPDDHSSWLGQSWTNATVNGNAPPTHIWMAPEVAGKFLDAKGTDGRPLYPTLGPSNVGGTADASLSGPFGTLHGLRAVIVPGLAGLASPLDAVVGSARAMAVAEDGSYRLTADVPSKAGRDVGMVGVVWAMPLRPDAFTVFEKV